MTLLPGEDDEADAFTVLLPDGRLLDGNDQTVVTVLLPSTDPAKGLNVEVSDSKDNHAARDTDKNGQIIVPQAPALLVRSLARIPVTRISPTRSMWM